VDTKRRIEKQPRKELLNMKLISWNVNGLRACVTKGFPEYFRQADADFFCIQESKLSEGQISLDLPGYHQYWNYAEKKGYSGTAVFTKHEPLTVSYGIGIDEHDHEGRVITLEYEDYYLITCYTPNSKSELARLPYRMQWEDDFRAYLQALDAKKPLILCGDLNVAHQEIDLKNPKTNRKNAGFTDEERQKMTELLQAGFTDTFRYFYPDATNIYSWWSYRFKAREKNAGWRIDYFITSNRLQERLTGAAIHTDITGSDHCPVELTIDL
jgi:exodeoxyribonuclease-3